MIAKLSQFHLQLSLPRPGPLCKNIQNQGRAVNDLHAQHSFQIVLLGWRQFIIQNQKICFQILDFHGQLIDFSPTQKKGRIRLFLALGEGSHHLGASRIRQPFQLCHGLFNGPAAAKSINSGENRSFRFLFGVFPALSRQFLVYHCHQEIQIDLSQFFFSHRTVLAQHLTSVLTDFSCQEGYAAHNFSLTAANRCHTVKAQAAQRGEVRRT